MPAIAAGFKVFRLLRVLHNRGHRPGREYGDVVAQWEIDDHGVLEPFGGVILLQLCAKTPCLAANDRVDLRVVVRTPTENSYPNRRLLQVDGFALQRRANDKVQELDEPVTAAHGATAANPTDCPPD